MMERCLTEGEIQAFLDGELNPQALESATYHIGLCDSCAFLLDEAEKENDFAFATLEQELNTMVPTQRLWSKINSSIEAERRNSSFGQRILAGISAFASQLSTASIAAFASLFIIAGVFTFVLNPRADQNKDVAENVYKPSASQTKTDLTNSVAGEQPQVLPAAISSNDYRKEVVRFNKSTVKNRTLKASFENVPSRKDRSEIRQNILPKESIETIVSPTTINASIPGEESYVKTIAALNGSIDEGKSLDMKPSAQFAIRKDLAVIDDAITKMRAEVIKNPKNEAAKQILFNSYQNKIDLLNSVSERNDLIASIK